VMRRGLLAAGLAVVFAGGCDGNPAHPPTPAPGPAVTTGTPQSPSGVQVSLR